ncbi:MAG: hypothetical protein JJU29_14830 [Verrucomicrobia bacterium]|nr:hypothetical protein [Verrucomicrobiota bacterium]MCH8510227.1 DUF5703 domain-containing protein [Kiritimatiellia bacterium]
MASLHAPKPLVFDHPGNGPRDSFPLGNGSVAANLWSAPDGSVHVQPAMSDAWDESMRLLKLGEIRITHPNADPETWEEVFDAATATWEVQSGEIRLRIWVDAHAPVLRMESSDGWTAAWTQWRTRERELTGKEAHSAKGLEYAPVSAKVYPDHCLRETASETVWVHANRSSLRDLLLAQQGLADWIGQEPDPIRDLVFGGRLRKESDGYSLTLHAQNGSVEKWEETLPDASPGDRSAHETFWWAFWDRSWIELSGFPEAERLTRAAALHRYMVSCCGRGKWPVKFNGGLFTTAWGEPEEDFDADYRRWGGGYWFQNTRLTYWPMLASGDHEQMLPFFRFYLGRLPFFMHRTRQWFGHEGAFVPEVVSVWGTYLGQQYGWDREGKKVHEVDNVYIRRYWTAGLELSFLMQEYFRHTEDQEFFEQEALPFIREVLVFFREHFPERDGRGRLRMTHAQCLEMWHHTTNPAPDLAGLRAVLSRMIPLDPARAEEWQSFLDILPPQPEGLDADGNPVLLPAEETFGEAQNTENPELYAVFPFRVFTADKPGAEKARRAFLSRTHTRAYGWHQHVQQAAYLGLADEAATAVLELLDAPNPGRFPAFWGPNLDWIPDLDHGSNLLMGLQTMLLQADEEEPQPFPAWPEHWHVRFRLHGPGKQVIEGER